MGEVETFIQKTKIHPNIVYFGQTQYFPFSKCIIFCWIHQKKPHWNHKEVFSAKARNKIKSSKGSHCTGKLQPPSWAATLGHFSHLAQDGSTLIKLQAWCQGHSLGLKAVFQSNSLSPAVPQTPVSNPTLCPQLLPPRLVPEAGDSASPQSPWLSRQSLRSSSRGGTGGQAG